LPTAYDRIEYLRRDSMAIVALIDGVDVGRKKAVIYIVNKPPIEKSTGTMHIICSADESVFGFGVIVTDNFLNRI